MIDVWHEWGADLDVGPTGDLLLAVDQDLGRQRIIRRLLTNPGAYVWHLDFGGGLGTYVGEPAAVEDIEAVIANQLAMERYVSSSPEPSVTIAAATSLNAGASVQVRYQSATEQATQVLKFRVPGSSP